MVTIGVVVGAVIWILFSFSLFFLQVGGDAILAELLLQVAIGPEHVDETEECHQHQDRGHCVEDDGFDVQVTL